MITIRLHWDYLSAFDLFLRQPQKLSINLLPEPGFVKQKSGFYSVEFPDVVSVLWSLCKQDMQKMLQMIVRRGIIQKNFSNSNSWMLRYSIHLKHIQLFGLWIGYEAKPFLTLCFFTLISMQKMVGRFSLIRNFLPNSNGCKLVKNAHCFVKLRKYLCFCLFMQQRKFFSSTERTFSPKQTQNATKNSWSSDLCLKSVYFMLYY